MATYAIGDIQGCYKTLKRLLRRISYNRNLDRIFLVGDLVNRGPDSLGVLRWAMDQGSKVITVLGNHDLHLIALDAGISQGRREKTLGKVLRAKDSGDIIQWLRNKPLLYREGRMVLVHAGILPAWTIYQASSYAHEVEKVLRSKKYIALLANWYRMPVTSWRNAVEGYERWSIILNVFCRMRMCLNAHEIDLAFTGAPEDAPKGLKPWFQVPGRESTDFTVIFGHWAALGLRVTSNAIALDSGCVWGRSLSAIRLDDGAIFSEPSAD